MITSYYRCCCINEPVIFSHCVHLKLGHRFHALLKVCSDRGNTAPLNGYFAGILIFDTVIPDANTHRVDVNYPDWEIFFYSDWNPILPLGPNREIHE